MIVTTKTGGKQRRRQQRRSAEEWRTIFERRAASGLSIGAFCRREGIAQSSYERWRTHLAEGRCAADAVVSRAETGFVEAGLLGSLARADAGARTELRLELGHGIVLHVVRN